MTFHVPRNVIATDINRNNAAVAQSSKMTLLVISIGLRPVLAGWSSPTPRGGKIMQGNFTKTRKVRKNLKTRWYVLRKTTKFIEELALENDAVVVVSDVSGKAKKRMKDDKNKR